MPFLQALIVHVLPALAESMCGVMAISLEAIEQGSAVNR